MTIPVGVLGANGRMGRTVCAAIAADPDLELVAAVDRVAVGERVEGVTIADDPQALADSDAQVAVDFTHPDAVLTDVLWCVDHGVHVVVGTTGMTQEDLGAIERRIAERGGGSNVFVAPNFAIGAVLMMHFAEQAARFLPAAEVIELHHDGKADAPSGTALATARKIAAARGRPYRGPDAETLPGSRGGDHEGVRIHSVRLPGLVAHQEVVLGGPGQTLSIRHDSMDRTSFMPGVLLAVKEVGNRPGLTVGLERLLGLDA
ncbi:MAG: 4-hydroxy-tetrahydrodipicolinate reductase [Actinomycetota bacterium]